MIAKHYGRVEFGGSVVEHRDTFLHLQKTPAGLAEIERTPCCTRLKVAEEHCRLQMSSRDHSNACIARLSAESAVRHCTCAYRSFHRWIKYLTSGFLTSTPPTSNAMEPYYDYFVQSLLFPASYLPSLRNSFRYRSVGETLACI